MAYLTINNNNCKIVIQYNMTWSTANFEFPKITLIIHVTNQSSDKCDSEKRAQNHLYPKENMNSE